MLKAISHFRPITTPRFLLASLLNISSNTSHSPRFASHSPRQKPDEVYDDNFVYNKDPDRPPNLFVVQPRLRPDTALQAKLSEALNLANSLEEQRDGFFLGDSCDKELPPHVIVQNPKQRSVKAHSDTYFGPGTVETIKCHLNAAETNQDELDAVFVNTILSGVQQRNLERIWGKPVLDRVGLIIEIFNAHAQTKEGKLQSELAALMYKKTRLVRVRGLDGKLTFGASGEAEVVSARGRGSGGRGFISGAGETELQLQRRRILERKNHLLSQIEEVRRTRGLQRASRRRRGGSQGQGLATVAVVGYTNAGKSTLVNALTESDLYSDDRLFATVDPRSRGVILPSGKKVLLSDTVGFISDLPVQLVEAFHATLEEVVEADLLVHVLDSSASNLEDQRSSVLEVLQQIGVTKEKLENMIEVWNKIDLRGEQSGVEDSLTEAADEEDGFTESEDCMESDPLSGESTDENNLGSELSPAGSRENVDEGKNSSSEDWMAMNGKQDCWKVVDNRHDNPSMTLMTGDDPQGESSDYMTIADVHCQDVKPVETSAIMGIGLQELLSLIDEKLNKQNVVERSSSDSLNTKWRPPRTVESDAAVEQ